MSDLTGEQVELVRRLFWHAADDDYICARLAVKNKLGRHFCWNAGQAIEKYIKCISIQSGHHAKFGHQFVEHFSKIVYPQHREAFPPILDIRPFVKVHEDLVEYSTEPLFECIKRFEKFADAALRYNEIDHLILHYDLQKLDLFVSFLRQVCADTPKERLAECKAADFWPTVNDTGKSHERKREALKWENCANFPDEYDASAGWIFMSGKSSPLTVHKLLDSTKDDDLSWLTEKTKINLKPHQIR